jgi:hypothetical protein
MIKIRDNNYVEFIDKFKSVIERLSVAEKQSACFLELYSEQLDLRSWVSKSLWIESLPIKEDLVSDKTKEST